MQVLNDRAEVIRSAAGRIQILVAKNQGPAMLLCPAVSGPKGLGMAQVQEPVGEGASVRDTPDGSAGFEFGLDMIHPSASCQAAGL